MNRSRNGGGGGGQNSAINNRRSLGLRKSPRQPSALERASISGISTNNTNNNNSNNQFHRSNSTGRISATNTSQQRQKRWNNRSNSNDGGQQHAATAAAVGTEAIAQSNMERNQREFKYPKEGFVTPIEHSLLYNMIKEPTIYPRSVIIQHILDEDFSQYLEVREKETSRSSMNSYNNNNNNTHNEKEDDEMEKRRTEALAASNVSYRQLSALLALSGENFPYSEKDNVSEVLGKTILRFLIKYCTDNDLDRSNEIQELLWPVENYACKRSANAELKAIVPLYAGYTATLLTANPIPVLVGLTLWNKKRIEAEKEIKNLQTFKDETARRSNVETSSLLDEMDE